MLRRLGRWLCAKGIHSPRWYFGVSPDLLMTGDRGYDCYECKKCGERWSVHRGTGRVEMIPRAPREEAERG